MEAWRKARAEKEEPGDEEAAPAAQVSFFFLSRETISPLRHSTTLFFFLLLDKIRPYHTSGYV
jgi:hypothetical protein